LQVRAVLGPEVGLTPEDKVNVGMRFEIERQEALPALAWLLIHNAGDDYARVIAGRGIEASNTIFWEGVNPSRGNPIDVLAHHFPLCTGATVRGDDIVAFTPGHILDRLFLIRQGARLFLSNSLPFALRAARAQLNPRELYYHWHFGAIQQHRQSAPLDRGRLEIFHNTNVAIGRDHSIRCEMKPASPPFRDYAEYIDLMHAYLEEVRAALGAGQTRYEPATTVSSGYDSPAAAVLAKSIGARRAFTLVNARHDEGESDSGAAIAERLGLEVSTRQRDEYRRFGLEAEKLFYASALPEDIVLYPFKGEMAGTLLFSGYKGDTMWDAGASPVGTWSWDPGGATLQNFRLSANFVHMPPAFFGWRRHADLLRISRSENMAPWSVGGGYDRPVARRIVEEAGVPRAWFGMEKKAVSATFGIDKSHYLAVADLGVSEEFAALLEAHRKRWSTPLLEAQMRAANGMHELVRGLHGALYKKDAPAGGGGRARAPTPLKAALKDLATRALDWRRPYMTPFSNLCFAAYVANDLMAREFPLPREASID
jgi:hypothetical protein